MNTTTGNEHSWINLRAPQLRELAELDATVILPVGAMEQHGLHQGWYS
jgi:creatinine amidohydrolase/Fe(II)-dependent formamide hydrolase-like protein